MVGLVIGVLFTKVVGARIRRKAETAAEQNDPDALPEQ
jgi:hypothetical protein